MLKNVIDKISGFFKTIYLKMVRINDTPQKVALGLGLGVFAGIMPFAGPILAVFLAALFRVNKVSAFLGALLTNTWITFIIFLLSIKVGSLMFGVDGNALHARWMALLKDFHFANFFKASFVEVALPVIAGYLAMAFFAAAVAYVMAITVIKIVGKPKEKV